MSYSRVPMDKMVREGPEQPHYRAIFVSPHLDDAVFSCGGLMAKLLQEGAVLVLNLFTQYPSDLKMHGAVLGVERYQEETDAARFLGFESRNLGELDAPFRQVSYRQLGNLFRPPTQQDMDWLLTLRQKLWNVLEDLDYDHIYVPLGIGWHVDHVLTHLVFESWKDGKKLLYYEDAPYCCLPHATRYRLNDVASYPRAANDIGLQPVHELRAWWQAAMAYANTALMKNLQPWIVRQCAVPAVSYYLFRLMANHRQTARSAAQRNLQPILVPITDQLERKVDAMALYRSQFGEFFSSRQDCIDTLAAYAKGMGKTAVERYWVVDKKDNFVE
jgi:LmbE family N-acetylglucosaminyl deacetylase